MKQLNLENLKMEIAHIFESGANEIRIFEMVKRLFKANNSRSFTLTWNDARENQPTETGRYWCIVEEQNDLGKSTFQWNCCYLKDKNMWFDGGNFYNVIWWTNLAPTPNQINAPMSHHL